MPCWRKRPCARGGRCGRDRHAGGSTHPGSGRAERFLDSFQLPVLAYLRDTQRYVQAAAGGLTLFDLPPGQRSVIGNSGSPSSPGRKRRIDAGATEDSMLKYLLICILALIVWWAWRAPRRRERAVPPVTWRGMKTWWPVPAAGCICPRAKHARATGDLFLFVATS